MYLNSFGLYNVPDNVPNLFHLILKKIPKTEIMELHK